MHMFHRRHDRRDRDAARPRRASASCGSAGPTRVASRCDADRRATALRAAARDASRGRSPRRRRRVDQAVVTYFPAPHSYTGEDVVEISAHGSPVCCDAIVARGDGAGARLAEPGEFTFRAYLHGRIDLVQAEAVARPDRRGDAAAGARGVRSARRHADGADPRDRRARCSISSRGSRRRSIFRTRVITSSTPADAARELDAIVRACSTRCWRRRARAADPRGPARSRSSGGRTPASRACSTGSPAPARAIVTDDAGDDARPADRDGRHRRRADDASSTRPACARDAGDAVEEEGIARARAARERGGSSSSSCSIGRGRSTDDDRALLDGDGGERRAWSSRTRAIWPRRGTRRVGRRAC